MFFVVLHQTQKTVKLSLAQHEALKKLIASSQDPTLRNVTLE